MLFRGARNSRSLRKLTTAATAAAMLAWGASAPAATYTWVGGTSTDYSNPNNWSPSGVPGPADVALFGPAASNQPSLSSSTTSGQLNFNTSGWQLGGGSSVLSLDGVSGIGILSTPTTGINEISTTLDIAALQTWRVATGGTLQIDGAIQDSNQLTIGSGGYGGTITLTNASPNYSGAININAGTLELGGATINGTLQFGMLPNVPVFTLNGGTFQINNTTAASGNQNNRLGGNSTIDFYSGSMVYIGSDVPGTASTEAVGTVNLNPGPIPVMTVTLPSANSSGSATLTLGSINQFQPGSTSFPDLYSGTLLMNGTNLGLTGGGTILATNAPTLIGSTAPAAGAESPGVYNQQIVPFLLGESGLGAGQGGTATGTPNTFLTYNPTTGFRPLNPTDEFASFIGDGSNTPDTTGDNVYLTTSQSSLISNNVSINSLVFNGTGTSTSPVVLTVPDGLTVTVASGSVLFATSGTVQNVFGGGTNFDLGSNAANIAVLPGQTATFDTNVISDGTPGTSMSVTGGGTLVFNGQMTAQDGITASNATITFNQGWNPVATSIYPFNAFDNSTFNFNGTSVVPASSDSSAAHIYMTTSTVNVNGTLTFNGGSGNFQDWHLDNSTINIGNAAGSAAAAFNANGNSGMIVAPLYGGNGTVNVYPNATFMVPNGLADFGRDAAGNVLVNVYGGSATTFNSVALGDNSAATAVPGILGALYLQPGVTLNITTIKAGNSVFSIGAAGGAPPNSTTGGGGVNNDFGYVLVPANASIGTSTAEAGEIDVGGELRTSSAVGGGNGVLDVMGGTLYAGAVALSGSNQDQQFSALNLVGGTLNLNPNAAGKGSGASVVTLAGTSTGATAGIYGAYSLLNVTNGSTIGMTGTNYALNVAGSSGGGTGQNPHVTYLLPTGIVTLSGSSSATFGYVRGGQVSLGGTPVAGSNPTIYDDTASSFVNFNGGTLNDNGGSATFIYQSIAGMYVYGGGAKIGGPGNSNAILSNIGFYAPPGQGIPTGTITVASSGSGYVAPPVVVISDPTGFDAAGYATVANGQVTSIVITNPGFNMSNPTVQLVGGGGSGASVTLPALVSNNSGALTVNVGSGTTFTVTGNFAGSNGNNGSGTNPSAIYSLTNTNGSDNYNIKGTSNTLAVDTSGNELGNNPYADGTFYGNTYPGIRNNISTYTGATIVQVGTLALSAPASSVTTGNPNNYAAGAFAATNNNIPFSSTIIVGDNAADSSAALNISGIAGSGGFQLAPGLLNSSTYNNHTYTYTSGPQVLAGFGTIHTSANVPLTIGLASGSVTATSTGTTSTGNNFGGYPFANGSTNNGGVITPTVNHSVISPGYTASGAALALMSNTSQFQPANPTYGTIVVGVSGHATPTFTFDSRQGNALNGPPTATGSLTVTALPTAGATTTLGAGGTYYWKLDLTNGGAGQTNTPGTATASPGLTANSPAVGTAWDQLILDTIALSPSIGASTTSGTTNAFTIEGVSFNSGIGVSNGSAVATNGSSMSTTPYSWVIARVGQSYSSINPAQLLAGLSLDTTNLPAPATGYQYFLSAQADAGAAADTDLVVNYAPVPEPTSLSLLGLGAGALMIRRRRRPATTDSV